MEIQAQESGTLTPEEIKLKKRSDLDAFMRGDIEEERKRKKLMFKEKHEIDVSEAAEKRRQRETLVQPAEQTPWQKENQDLEQEGLDTRNPELIVMGGEKRVDEEIGK